MTPHILNWDTKLNQLKIWRTNWTKPKN